MSEERETIFEQCFGTVRYMLDPVSSIQLTQNGEPIEAQARPLAQREECEGQDPVTE